MGRQLFLHHYLPAHLASTLVTGALIEFVFNIEPLQPEELDVKNKKKIGNTRKPIRERVAAHALQFACTEERGMCCHLCRCDLELHVLCAFDVRQAWFDG